MSDIVVASLISAISSIVTAAFTLYIEIKKMRPGGQKSGDQAGAATNDGHSNLHPSKVRWTLILTIALIAGAIAGPVYLLFRSSQAKSAIPPAVAEGLPVIADFNSCKGTDNLQGSMGTAYSPPDIIKESYVAESERGCVAALEYHITTFGAFWMKLRGANFVAPYQYLAFDMKGDAKLGFPSKVKVEAKRLCTDTYDPPCQETSVKYVTGITDEWQTFYVSLNPADWDALSWTPSLSSFEQMGQLVFTIEADSSNSDGILFLDNIRVALSRE